MEARSVQPLVHLADHQVEVAGEPPGEAGVEERRLGWKSPPVCLVTSTASFTRAVARPRSCGYSSARQVGQRATELVEQPVLPREGHAPLQERHVRRGRAGVDEEDGELVEGGDQVGRAVQLLGQRGHLQGPRVALGLVGGVADPRHESPQEADAERGVARGTEVEAGAGHLLGRGRPTQAVSRPRHHRADLRRLGWRPAAW